ncbi:MAG TPA: ergothioneine biosynthesis protein EgtB [Kofleriaceae bacterium]|jgi:ergothioneine biosynthesis protein EgtB
MTSLLKRFHAVRARTVSLCAPLSVEDQLLQPMVDASPAKWHLAHTTWFFETIVLRAADPTFNFLFNSYYEGLGPRVDRARRGMMSRPSLDEVHAYRRSVDERTATALESGSLDAEMVELGIQHEQQHQELILTDAKYALGTQPLRPAYRDDLRKSALRAELTWHSFDGGVIEIGADARGFAFDNERPRHRVFVEPFRIATRAIANRDVQEFIAANGYRNPAHWLSDGWAAVSAGGWTSPLYWDGDQHYTLGGMRAIDPDETACHLSYYEADAIARWRGARLPTEAEWELAAATLDAAHGNFVDDDHLAPSAVGGMFGDVWEWTSSAYLAYPGFRPLGGAVGEYNGKFMSGQQVLRGGSCFTPRDHIRRTYRNFFPPAARWQMSGARLVEEGGHR